MKSRRFVILILFVLFIHSGCGKNESVLNTGTTGSRTDTVVTPSATTENSNPDTQITPGATAENSNPGAQITPKFTNDYSQEKPYLYPVKDNDDKWGYINSEGKVIIDFIYDHAGFFADGTAVVSINDRYGLIDLDGKTIIQPQYGYIGSFSEGLAHIVQYDADTIRHGFINKDGTVFYRDYFNNNTGDLHDGLAVFEKDFNFGYVDATGDIAIQPENFMAYDFSEGLAAVANEDDKLGFIDTKGNLVIPFNFEHNFDGTYLYQGFSNGLAAVSIDGKFGYISINGNFAIEPKFDYAGRFNDGIALIVLNGLYGYIDRDGKYTIEPQFAHASSFHNGFAFVRRPEKTDYEETGGYALINKNGDFVTDENLVYEDGGGYTFFSEWNTGFVGNLARVVMIIDNGIKFVYINRSGEVVWELAG